MEIRNTVKTHAYSYIQLKFINFGMNRNQWGLLETALQQWKVPFGPEHPEASQLQRLCGKHTTSCCAHARVLMETYLITERKTAWKPVFQSYLWLRVHSADNPRSASDEHSLPSVWAGCGSVDWSSTNWKVSDLKWGQPQAVLISRA